MNVTFLVHADNAVYQICTYAVKSQDMTNMQKYAPHFADGALPLQVGVGLTPRRRRLFCSGTLCARAEAMEGSFLPALDKDQADMFTPSELRLY